MGSWWVQGWISRNWFHWLGGFGSTSQCHFLANNHIFKLFRSLGKWDIRNIQSQHQQLIHLRPWNPDPCFDRVKIICWVVGGSQMFKVEVTRVAGPSVSADLLTLRWWTRPRRAVSTNMRGLRVSIPQAMSWPFVGTPTSTRTFQEVSINSLLEVKRCPKTTCWKVLE